MWLEAIAANRWYTVNFNAEFMLKHIISTLPCDYALLSIPTTIGIMNRPLPNGWPMNPVEIGG